MKHAGPRSWLLPLVLGACAGQIGETEEPDREPAAAPGLPGAPPAQPPPGETAGGARPASAPPGDPGPAFACPGPDGGGTPRRLWRLSAAQYRNSIAVLFGGRPTATRPTVSPPANLLAVFDYVNTADRFSGLAASYTMTDAEFRELQAATQDVSTRLVAALRKDPSSCLGGAKTPFAECMRAVVAQRGALMFRRPLAADEVSRYAGIAAANAGMLGEDDAAQVALQAMLMSPHFVFRIELGQGTPDAAGRVPLGPHEVAAALAYALTDFPPDEELWQAAESGRLASPEQIRAQVQRLAGPLAGREPVVRFLREYLGYDRASAVFKDAKLFPFHDAPALEEETELWVKDVLSTSGRADFLKTLLTAPTAFVRQKTAPSYGVANVRDTRPVKVSLPPGQRAGILTQPSLLVALSHADETDPVRRGRFVSESLLCRPVPDLPIAEVPKLPDLGPNATLRDRLKIHSADPGCAACHRLMDPIGLGLEGYDHLGRHRTTEAGRPVDVSGQLDGAGPGADGPFAGGVELAQRLAAAPAVSRCFVRHAFTYWLGRAETAADGCALAAAHAAFAREGDAVELLATLFTSPSFLYRTAGRQP